ncbi:leukocyte immunoglobulin-like receptor subfamily A member 2 isoform X4 [Mirounga angustirostris]|uniref:leukocyte immunoglobulin-like receptor subfamily A member 2 isoform X4 n=1 Tax=Mirounga angustirostris TaxID=9716 RepID=UPI00313ADE1E
MGGSAGTLTLTALLYLGELSGNEEGWGCPSPQPPGPGPWEISGLWRISGGRTSGGRSVLSPRCDPGAQGPKPGLEQLHVGGGRTHRNSLPGLCRGLWDQARAGTLPKPSIWADPGPMVTKGSPVTIWCQASLRADVYYLYKERIYESLPMKTSEDSSDRASFYFASMSSHSSGRYRCAYQRGKSWSQRSDLLALVVTGVYDAPSLSANSALVVASGGNVSLSCSSLWQLGSFHLLKERGADVTQYLEMTFRRERYQAVFLVGPVNTSHGGIYRCYTSHESYPYLWSQPSDPLHLQVTGVYREPSLSAQPGSLLQSGDNLTLQCRSETGFDRFALTKDEELRAPQRLDGQPSPNFTLGPVSSTHGGGRYSCYCGHKLSSTWSAPSAPLDVLITGPSSAGHSETLPGQVHPESCDLSPRGDLQVLRLIQRLPLPVVPAQ